MKNKGFTLVELIAVISLLAVIGLIAVPVIEGVLKKSKDKIYNTQVEEIKSAAKKATTEDPNLIASTDDIDSIICLSTLKQNGYLENTKIVDPRNNSIMNGGVIITYISSTKTYNYNYDENTKYCK